MGKFQMPYKGKRGKKTNYKKRLEYSEDAQDDDLGSVRDGSLEVANVNDLKDILGTELGVKNTVIFEQEKEEDVTHAGTARPKRIDLKTKRFKFCLISMPSTDPYRDLWESALPEPERNTRRVRVKKSKDLTAVEIMMQKQGWTMEQAERWLAVVIKVRKWVEPIEGFRDVRLWAGPKEINETVRKTPQNGSVIIPPSTGVFKPFVRTASFKQRQRNPFDEQTVQKVKPNTIIIIQENDRQRVDPYDHHVHYKLLWEHAEDCCHGQRWLSNEAATNVLRKNGLDPKKIIGCFIVKMCCVQRLCLHGVVGFLLKMQPERVGVSSEPQPQPLSVQPTTIESAQVREPEVIIVNERPNNDIELVTKIPKQKPATPKPERKKGTKRTRRLLALLADSSYNLPNLVEVYEFLKQRNGSNGIYNASTLVAIHFKIHPEIAFTLLDRLVQSGCVKREKRWHSLINPPIDEGTKI